MIKYGKTIIPYGVYPENHELEIARYFNKLGKNVYFITPNRSKNIKNPDIQMDNIIWEIKSPKGNSNRTIENNLRNAAKQSKNIIIDLRRIKINEEKAILQIKKEFQYRKNINRIIIIKKNQLFVDILR